MRGGSVHHPVFMPVVVVVDEWWRANPCRNSTVQSVLSSFAIPLARRSGAASTSQ